MNRSETHGSPRSTRSGEGGGSPLRGSSVRQGTRVFRSWRFPRSRTTMLVSPPEQGALRLPVECREITLLQGLRCGQGPQGCDHAGKLAVEIVARGAGDLERGAVLRGAVGRSETDNSERGEQEPGKDQGSSRTRTGRPAGARAGPARARRLAGVLGSARVLPARGQRARITRNFRSGHQSQQRPSGPYCNAVDNTSPRLSKSTELLAVRRVLN